MNAVRSVADRIVGGRRRARPIGEMLAAAQAVARQAKITRLADITALDRFALPVFQVSRPAAKCLSTALGKGVTRRAAMVSAFLEGIEINAAEDVPADGPPRALEALGDDALRTWSSTPRADLAIRLDPRLARSWLPGSDLLSGQTSFLPFDLVSLDFTLSQQSDVLRATIGLASGGTEAEAHASAVAELLEHEWEAEWSGLPPAARRRTRVDLASIDGSLVQAVVRRIERADAHLHLWATNQDPDIASFSCAITDGAAAPTCLPPTSGSGCHPDRTVAALLAILEAAQARVAMISGSRDDLIDADYADARRRTVEFVLETASFAPGGIAWSYLPARSLVEPEAALDILLSAATQATSLPVVATVLPSPHPAIAIVKVVAPGLRYLSRGQPSGFVEPLLAPPSTPIILRPRPRPRRRLVFVGPTLWDAALPQGVERRPPAGAGDLVALLDEPPEAVGLIDGRFESGPSVWHKEVLDLIAHGTTVYGAASLGALRAAELQSDGMIGVGRIFEAFHDGRLVRDDAVMLTHAPAELGFQPLTLALVDAEAALAAAEMPASERRMLQRISRVLSFRDRTWPTILRQFEAHTGRPPAIAEAELAAIPSLKRADALQMISIMGGAIAPGPAAARPPLTSYYRKLLAQRRTTPLRR